MSLFEFEADEECRLYCEAIVRAMVAEFGISHDEAVGRLNKAFQPQRLLGTRERQLLGHRLPKEWAHDIYLGRGWWRLPPEERKPTPLT